MSRWSGSSGRGRDGSNGTPARSRPSRRAVLAAAAAGASGGVAGCLNRGPSPGERVREHRDDLSRFTDVGTALEQGYRTTAKYVRTADGALGEALVNFDVESVDPARPNALLYTLTEGGRYELLGCKWFVPAKETDSPPELFGRAFDGPFESQIPFVPRHYALHAWLFRENPRGLFARYNPAVDPPGIVDRIATARTALSRYTTGAKATEAGYRNTEKCVATDRGAYGVAFVRERAAATGGTDLEKPPILLYRVTENWSYVLLGAEWYVPSDRDPPTMFGRRFHDAAPAHSPEVDQPDHHGLHAWLFRTNPRGMFARFNPSVTC